MGFVRGEMVGASWLLVPVVVGKAGMPALGLGMLVLDRVVTAVFVVSTDTGIQDG